MRAVSYIADIGHSVDKEMAGPSHTSGCYLSKHRSNLDACKKQLRVWPQYLCSVTEVLLYPSFCAPLVLLWCSYRDLEESPLYFLLRL